MLGPKVNWGLDRISRLYVILQQQRWKVAALTCLGLGRVDWQVIPVASHVLSVEAAVRSEANLEMPDHDSIQETCILESRDACET